MYFCTKDGLRALVDSLHFGTEGITVINQALDGNDKLQELFNKEKGFEALIDYLYKGNKNLEGKLMDPAIIMQVLEILELGSLNEIVRASLSDKKKIKDLFLVVVKSIDQAENRPLVSSLVQFAANLCYGNGKFRVMLRTEIDFLGTIHELLKSTEKEANDQKKD